MSQPGPNQQSRILAALDRLNEQGRDSSQEMANLNTSRPIRSRRPSAKARAALEDKENVPTWSGGSKPGFAPNPAAAAGQSSQQPITRARAQMDLSQDWTIPVPLSQPRPNEEPYDGDGMTESDVEEDPVYTLQVQVSSTVVGGDRGPKPKRKTETKIGAIAITETTRYDFACEILCLHGLEDAYEPSKHDGFPFRIWYPGWLGGKGLALSVRTDTDFASFIKRLQGAKKPVTTILVAYDLDEMEKFTVVKKGATALAATSIPHEEGFAASTRLNGTIIAKLKRKHACQLHHNACYVSATNPGEHLHLTFHRLNLWASAIVAGEADEEAPPNSFEFDVPRTTKRRAAIPSGSSSTTGYASNALLTAVTALLASSIAKGVAGPSTERTPQKRKHREIEPFESPDSPPADRIPIPLDRILEAFSEDLSPHDQACFEFAGHALTTFGLTSELIDDIKVERLMELTHLKEVEVYRMQKFIRSYLRKHANKGKQCRID